MGVCVVLSSQVSQGLGLVVRRMRSVCLGVLPTRPGRFCTIVVCSHWLVCARMMVCHMVFGEFSQVRCSFFHRPSRL